jgi:hypothetical protein
VAEEAPCALGDGTVMEIDTFTSSDAEDSWITAQGEYDACCVEGRLWAATVDATVIPSEPDWQKVLSAIGGREVSNIGGRG